MKSQILLWNKALFKYFSGSVIWLSFIYLIVSIISLPLPLWVVSVNVQPEDLADAYYTDFFYQLATPHIVLSMIYAVLLVLFMFNFKNNEDSSDFIHSLPVKRQSILTNALLVGFIVMTLPVIITGITLFFLRYAVIFDITASEVGLWMIFALFVLYTVFSVSVFAGFLVNKIFVHLQMIIVLFFLPLAFWGMTVVAASMFFDGIPTGSYMSYVSPLLEPVVNNTFPVFAVEQLIESFAGLKILIWTGVAVVLTILSYILYAKRKNEYVQSPFTYKWVKDILTALITIIGMLAIGTLISAVFETNILVQSIFFALGFIISFMIIEMFFQSSVKLEFSLRTILTALVSVIVFWTAFVFGWNYYINQIPDRTEVESVYVENESMYPYHGYYSYYYDDVTEYFTEDFLFVNDEAFIDAVYQTHEYAVNHKTNANELDIGDRFDVTYKLQDGSTFSRSFYSFLDEEEGVTLLENVKRYNLVVEHDFISNIINSSTVNELSLSSSVTGERIVLRDSGEISGFVTDYKSNLMQMKEGYGPLVNLESNAPWVGLMFGENHYYEGPVSIYHPTVASLLSDNGIDISEFYSVDVNRDMYTVELTGDEKDAFFRDFEREPFEVMESEYELTPLSDDEKENMIENINDNALDTSGDKLLIYDIYSYDEVVDYGHMGEEIHEEPAFYNYNLIGIE